MLTLTFIMEMELKKLSTQQIEYSQLLFISLESTSLALELWRILEQIKERNTQLTFLSKKEWMMRHTWEYFGQSWMRSSSGSNQMQFLLSVELIHSQEIDLDASTSVWRDMELPWTILSLKEFPCWLVVEVATLWEMCLDAGHMKPLSWLSKRYLTRSLRRMITLTTSVQSTRFTCP